MGVIDTSLEPPHPGLHRRDRQPGGQRKAAQRAAPVGDQGGSDEPIRRVVEWPRHDGEAISLICAMQ